MDWQPQPGPLAQLAQYLRDSLSGYDPKAQKNAEQVGQDQSIEVNIQTANRLTDAQTSERIARHQQLPHISEHHKVKLDGDESGIVARSPERSSDQPEEQSQIIVQLDTRSKQGVHQRQHPHRSARSQLAIARVHRQCGHRSSATRPHYGLAASTPRTRFNGSE